MNTRGERTKAVRGSRSPRDSVISAPTVLGRLVPDILDESFQGPQLNRHRRSFELKCTPPSTISVRPGPQPTSIHPFALRLLCTGGMVRTHLLYGSLSLNFRVLLRIDQLEQNPFMPQPLVSLARLQLDPTTYVTRSHHTSRIYDLPHLWRVGAGKSPHCRSSRAEPPIRLQVSVSLFMPGSLGTTLKH
jgi:hypothetical protein